MAVKRWQGNTSAAWDTAANWIGGVKPVGQGSAIAIDEAGSTGYDSANRRLSLKTATHTLAAGDSIRFAGFMLAKWYGLNWSAYPLTYTVETAVDNTHITLLLPTGGNYDVVHDQLTTWPTCGADSGTVQFMGDDVQMLSGDKGTNYCTTGPASNTNVNSLTITLAGGVTGSTIMLTSSAEKILIASTFSFTEAAGTVTSGYVVGTSVTAPIMQNGCVGTALGQPPTSANRTLAVTVITGATLTASALPSINATDTGDFRVGGSNTVCTGTITLAGDNPGINSGAYLNSGGVVNVNRTLLLGLGTYTNHASTTININAQAFWPLYVIAGGTINANAPLAMTHTTSNTCITQNTTINANAPVTLANFGVTNGKTLTVNVSGPNAVTQVDVTGTVVVNNRFVTPAGVGPSSLLTVGA